MQVPSACGVAALLTEHRERGAVSSEFLKGIREISICEKVCKGASQNMTVLIG